MNTQKTNDGTEIVPNAELQLIIEENKLPSEMGTVLQEKFAGVFAQIGEWKKQDAELEITSIDQVDAIEKAKQGQKEISRIRIDLEATRKELKKPYLDMGRVIDSTAKTLAALIAPLEESLKEKAQFAQRLEQLRIDELTAARKAQLLAIGYTEDMPNLSDFSEQAWTNQLNGIKYAKEQEAKEAERLASEKAEREEAARIEQEEKEKVAQARIARGESRMRTLSEFGPVPYALDHLADMPSDVFESLVITTRTQKEEADKAERLKAEEYKRKVDLRSVRSSMILALGEEYHGVTDLAELSEDDFNALCETAKALKESKAKTQQRKDEMSSYILYIRDYDGMLAMNDDDYAKEFAEIKQAFVDEQNYKAEQQRLEELGISRMAQLKAISPTADIVGDISLHSVAEWDAILEKIQNEKKLQDEKAMRERLEKEAADKAAKEAQEWQAREDKRIAQEKAEREAQEAKNAAAPDVDKLLALQLEIEAIQLPECSTEQGKKVVGHVGGLLEKVQGFIELQIFKMK